MTHPIYIKRSVKEKLPTKDDYYTVIQEGWLHQRIVRYYPGIPAWEYNYKDITHWLEEVPLEEYLKERIKSDNNIEIHPFKDMKVGDYFLSGTNPRSLAQYAKWWVIDNKNGWKFITRKTKDGTKCLRTK